MKNLLLVFVTASFVLFALNSNANMNVKKEKTKTVTMEVGFHCAGGKATIEKKLSEVEGIKEYTVDLSKKTVTVEYFAKKTDKETLKKAMLDLGYTVDGEKPEKKHECGGH